MQYETLSALAAIILFVWEHGCSFINLTEWRQRRVTCQQLIGYIKYT